jgi:hypothetical protein
VGRYVRGHLLPRETASPTARLSGISSRVEGKVLAEKIHKRRPSQEGQWYTRMTYVVEFQRPGAGVERVELVEPEKLGTKVIAPLSRGSAVPLLVDPKSDKVRFDTDDPRINLKTRTRQSKQRDDDEFEKALKG